MAQEASMFQSGDLNHSYEASDNHDIPSLELRLPSSFKWGTATAAYQIEGAAEVDGKGPSIWDEYTHRIPSRTNNQNGDVACDHVRRVAEDVKLMKSLGVDVYRFSLSWPRIIPLGGRNDPINEEGIAFYSDLIDELQLHGIQPAVTLYHWDVPQALYDRYQAFLNTEEFKADYMHYAQLCFERFGARVRQWVTFNEPYIISIFGYLNGTLAPGHRAQEGFDTRHEPWRVGHTLILAHASVVELYSTQFQAKQGGAISIVLNGHFYEPFSNSQVDKDAASKRLEFFIAWFGDPIFLGTDYPASMRADLGDRLPVFTDDDLTLLRNTARSNAFYGMNHYSTKYARALPGDPAEDDWTGNIEEGPVDHNGVEIGPASQMQWLRIAPNGFRKLLKWAWDRYGLPVIVTENGCPCPEDSVEAAVDDKFRQRYFALYLDAISRSIYDDGVRVEGYYVWTLMDNFEWSAGYEPKFGIVHVDFESGSLDRTPKNSALYLKSTFEKRRQKDE